MKRIILFYILLFLNSAVIAQVVNTFKIDSSKLNKPLMLSLDSIYKDDQADRLKLQELSKNKENTDSLWKIIRKKDEQNLTRVNQILDKYGWPGVQDVGTNGSQTLFLVIQHADLPTQEKYLPMIRNSVKEGKTLSSNLAILEDRIAMREGKNQIYGSQVVNNKATGKAYVYPIVDPDHVDERRKAMGLPPMTEYCMHYNIKWDLEEFKKMTPEVDSDSM